MSPSLLQAHSIPVVRVVQQPGEFVVTYPGGCAARQARLLQHGTRSTEPPAVPLLCRALWLPADIAPSSAVAAALRAGGSLGVMPAAGITHSVAEPSRASCNTVLPWAVLRLFHPLIRSPGSCLPCARRLPLRLQPGVQLRGECELCHQDVGGHWGRGGHLCLQTGAEAAAQEWLLSQDWLLPRLLNEGAFVPSGALTQAGTPVTIISPKFVQPLHLRQRHCSKGRLL